MNVPIPLVAAVAALAATQPLAAKSANASCKPKNLAALSGWNGVWAAEGSDAPIAGLSGHDSSGDVKLIGFAAPWNDTGWGRMAAMLKRANAPNSKGAGFGFPMMMDSFSEFTFVISPAETVIINGYRDIRSIYTDGRGHLPEEDRWPTNWGDSIGCWQGDTLVIDTVGVRFDPAFNVAAPPLSEQAHFVERLRLTAPGHLEDEMTITDPALLTAPWTVRVTYIPAGLDRLVHDAFEDRIDGDAQTIKPAAQDDFAPLQLTNVKLSTAELDAVAGRYSIEGAPLEFLFERKGDRLYVQPPGFDGFIPLFAQGPLEYQPIDGGRMRFTVDPSGAVTGLEFDGIGPNAATGKGKRKLS